MKKTVERTVQKAYKKVVEGKYDYNIMIQLMELSYQLDFRNHKDVEGMEQSKKRAPLFTGFSLKELKTIRKQMIEKLLKELNKEENSYLKTSRIITSIFELDAFKKVKCVNDKVTFCKKNFEWFRRDDELCYSEEPLQSYFRVVALLDRQ